LYFILTRHPPISCSY